MSKYGLGRRRKCCISIYYYACRLETFNGKPRISQLGQFVSKPNSNCVPSPVGPTSLQDIANTQTCSDPVRTLSHMACQSHGDPVFGRHKQRISIPMLTISKQHWNPSAFQIRNILPDTVTDRFVLYLWKSTVVMFARGDIQMFVIYESYNKFLLSDSSWRWYMILSFWH
jgi:hypothetical protein